MSNDGGPVDALIRDHQSILDHLLISGEASYVATLETTVPKVFLLAAASWTETRVREILLEFFRDVAGDLCQASEFVRINAIDMKYHSWFDWKDRKPGKFFSLFGRDMKVYGAKVMREDPEFAAQFDAFLELGDLRNQLVHQNYASFTLEKTAEEVRRLYVEADKFVDRLPELLRSKVGRDEESS